MRTAALETSEKAGRSHIVGLGKDHIIYGHRCRVVRVYRSLATEFTETPPPNLDVAVGTRGKRQFGYGKKKEKGSGVARGQTSVSTVAKKRPPEIREAVFWVGCEFGLGGDIEVEQPLNWMEEIFERVLKNITECVGDLTECLHVCL